MSLDYERGKYFVNKRIKKAIKEIENMRDEDYEYHSYNRIIQQLHYNIWNEIIRKVIEIIEEE